MSVLSTASPEINDFFQTLYGSSPEISQDKKTVTYALPKRGVSVITDSFGGCHIDVKELSAALIPVAQGAIEKLSKAFSENTSFDSIWIDISLPSTAQMVGSVLPASFVIGKPGSGDLIYDVQAKKIRVWQWLNPNKECAIPPGATHNIGATALVVDRAAGKVLLVEPIRRKGSWNLPGGSFDVSKDYFPSQTAIREAEEEGGFQIENRGKLIPTMVGQMQFPSNQFAPAVNQIWAFFIEGVSQKALNPPAAEINRAEWVDIESVLSSKGTLFGLKVGEEITAPLAAAMKGSGFEQIVDKKWMILHAPKP